MPLTTERVLTVVRALVHEFRAERVTFMAGSIAYHAFVSLLPLLLLVLAVISAVGSRSLQDGLIALTSAVLTPGASDALIAELESANATTGVSVLGAALLVWGTLRIFRGLDTAFSDIYESGTANTFTDQLADGLAVLFAVAFAVILGAVVETRIGGLAAIPGGWFVRRLVLVVGLFVVLFPMYYVFPDEDDMLLREAVPGTAFAAVGLTAFQALFGIYIAVSSRAPRESLLAGVLVFLTWLYFSGLVILMGVVINAVLSNRSVDVSIQPVVGGVAPDFADPDDTERDVTDQLKSLEQRLETADKLTVDVDGDRLTLPAPTSVGTETDTSSLLFVDDQVELQLAWNVAETPET
jgi:membrane protein